MLTLKEIIEKAELGEEIDVQDMANAICTLNSLCDSDFHGFIRTCYLKA